MFMNYDYNFMSMNYDYNFMFINHDYNFMSSLEALVCIETREI